MPATDLTAEDIADWLTPRQAIEILDGSFHETYLSKKTLLGRLAGGMVDAVSEHSVIGTWRPNIYKLSPDDWRRIETSDNFWITGDLIYEQRPSHGIGLETVRHFGIRFEPKGVRAIIGNAALPDTGKIQAPIAPPPANKGGRPRKDWWDDFWIEICQMIYEGDLKPKSQAELERAMLDWVSDHGYDVGETTIKNAAKKLFKAWNL
jgi:hypothetical protein